MGSRIRVGLLAAGLLAGATAAVDAAQLTVCAAGCTYTNTQLQTALNAAANGDEVIIQSGFTYVGNFTLPAVSCVANDATCWKTLRSGVSSSGTILANSTYPTDHIRISPSYASVLGKLQPASNEASAITAVSGASWWRIKWTEVKSNTYGGGSLILTCSTTIVANESLMCHDFEYIANYIHGDPVIGQFRGIFNLANKVVIRDNYIEHIKSLAEGQCLTATFATDYTVTNNFCSGGMEVSMIGGSDGIVQHSSAVAASPAPTVNSATLADVTDIAVGKGISLPVTLAGGVSTLAQFTIASVNTGTKAITWTPNADVAPDVGGLARWGLRPTNITVTKNVFTRPIGWLNPIVGMPQSVTATVNDADASGTLTPGTYAYRVVAQHPFAQGQTVRSTASAEVTGTIATGTGSVTITWAPVTNATSYLVYKGSVGGEDHFVNVGSATTYTDSGAAGTAGAVPTTSGTKIPVKNVFELKLGTNVLVEGNIIENTWNSAQVGYMVVVTAANGSCNNGSAIVDNVTFRNNIIRHGPGGFNIIGRGQQKCPSGQLKPLTITNNLIYDLDGNKYGGTNNLALEAFAIGSGYTGQEIYNYIDTLPNTTAPQDFTIEHNTIDCVKCRSMLMLQSLTSGGASRQVINWIVRNNIFNKGDFGIFGSGCVAGNACWLQYSFTDRVWQQNVAAAATCSAYPTGSICPTLAVLRGYYTNYAQQDFTLLSTSPYAAGGAQDATDNTDLGADIAAIKAFTNKAVSGDDTGATPLVPPVITTTLLPNGQIGTPYSTTIAASSCGTGCTWAITAGTLPTGITRSGAVLSGTPSAAGTFPFTVQATASNGATSVPIDYTIQIIDVAPPVEPPPDSGGGSGPTDRPPRYDYVENGAFVRADQPDVELDKVRFGDFWIDSTLGKVKWLKTTAPSPQWSELVDKDANGSAISSLGAGGTPGSTTFLRGDNVWAVPPSAGGSGGASGAPDSDTLGLMAPAAAATTWTLSTTQSELVNNTRNRIVKDLTNYDQCRVIVRIGTKAVGAATTVLPQYSTDSGSTWNDLGSTAGTPAVDLTQNFENVSAFVPIATAAKAAVQVRIVGTSADVLTTQPVVSMAAVECRTVTPVGISGVPDTDTIMLQAGSAAANTWTLTTTLSEFLNQTRNRGYKDLTNFDQCQVQARVSTQAAGSATTVWAQYSTDGTTWNDLGTTASTPAVDVSSGGHPVSAWTSIATGAKTNVQLRLAGVSAGTLTTQPIFNMAAITCRTVNTINVPDTDTVSIETPGAGLTTWTLTTTQSEFLNQTRNRAYKDLSSAKECRVIVRVGTQAAGSTTTVVGQYSTDLGATWSDLGTTAGTPSVDVSAAAQNVSSWAAVKSAAKTNVMLRLAGTSGGTLTTQPQINNAYIACRTDTSTGSTGGGGTTDASALTTGTLNVNRLGTSGTRDATTYLRGDNTWQVPPGGGGAVSTLTSTVATTGTTEEDLWTYTVPAGTLSADGKGYRIVWRGLSSVNSSTKTLKFYVGATSFSLNPSTAAVPSGNRMAGEVIVMRTGASAEVMFTTTALVGTVIQSIQSATPAEATSGSIVVKITGTSTTAGDLSLVNVVMIPF